MDQDKTPHFDSAAFEPLASRMRPGTLDDFFAQGYKYPHNYPNNFVDQDYMPDELKEVKYYHPSSSGLEGRLYADWLKRRDGQRRGK